MSHQASRIQSSKNVDYTTPISFALFLFLALSPYAISMLNFSDYAGMAITVAGVLLIGVLGKALEMRSARLHAMDDVGAEDSAQSHESSEVDRLPQNPSSAEDSMARS